MNPLEDGVTHINIYTRGQTMLGRGLTNLAPLGFCDPLYGSFNTVEGYWFWLSTGSLNDDYRTATGMEAKKLGQSTRSERVEVPQFETFIKLAIVRKLMNNFKLQSLLKQSIHPLTHYYFYGKPENPKVVVPKGHEWQTEYWTLLRELLKNDQPLELEIVRLESEIKKTQVYNTPVNKLV